MLFNNKRYYGYKHERDQYSPSILNLFLKTHGHGQIHDSTLGFIAASIFVCLSDDMSISSQ